jgi:hypothetical protein
LLPQFARGTAHIGWVLTLHDMLAPRHVSEADECSL